MEIWLPIEGFDNYEVSSNGRIRNVKTGRILKPIINSHGYCQVFLRRDNKQHQRAVHRLVADAFYDGVHSGLDVNHDDGNKTNNFVGNLEWCTRSENILHAFRTGLKEPSHRKRIRIIETGEVYNSIRECARAIRGDSSAIRRCLQGKENSCRGYHFELLN